MGSRIGVPKSAEHRRKIGLAHKGRKKGPSPFRLTNAEVKKRIIKAQGRKYELSKINYVRCGVKIELVCKKHGSFWKIPTDIMYSKSYGCPKCSGCLVTIDEYRARWKSKAGFKPWCFKNTPLPKGMGKERNLTANCKLHGPFTFHASDFGTRGIGGCKECNYTEIKEKRFLAGRCVRDPKGKEYQTYRQTVRRYSMISFKRYFPGEIRTMDWHLDHIYSIMDGWLNNVSPEIIGHHSNLQMIDGNLNRSKNCRSDKTLKKLFSDYRKAKRNEAKL